CRSARHSAAAARVFPTPVSVPVTNRITAGPERARWPRGRWRCRPRHACGGVEGRRLPREGGTGCAGGVLAAVETRGGATGSALRRGEGADAAGWTGAGGGEGGDGPVDLGVGVGGHDGGPEAGGSLRHAGRADGGDENPGLEQAGRQSHGGGGGADHHRED